MDQLYIKMVNKLAFKDYCDKPKLMAVKVLRNITHMSLRDNAAMVDTLITDSEHFTILDCVGDEDKLSEYVTILKQMGFDVQPVADSYVELLDGISELAQNAVATGNYDLGIKLINILSAERVNEVDDFSH